MNKYRLVFSESHFTDEHNSGCQTTIVEAPNVDFAWKTVECDCPVGYYIIRVNAEEISDLQI
ncbi:MAG: hypothetical protein QXN55_00055 [Candidatus Nitrosotenuis sp.]